MRAPLLLAAMLSGCPGDEPAPRDPATAVRFDFSIPLGDEFAAEPTEVSEDSRGATWTAPGVRIATDFGEYGPSPDCEGKPCERLLVDGHEALLQRIRGEDGSGQLHLDVIVYPPYDLRLVVIATCEVAARCEALVPALSATSIRILDQ